MGARSSTVCPHIHSSMTSKPSQDSSIQPTERAHQWVDSPEALARVASELARETTVGVDTESDSFHHYQEQVCLVQMSTAAADYIIDPLAPLDLTTLRQLFADRTREWIMNGADYDIVCLKRDFGIHFGRIFDT